MCFPSGVKVCYLMEEKSEKIKQKEFSNKFSSFVNIITNEKGQKFNLFILQYYKKLEISEFQKSCNIDTVREYMKLKSFVRDNNSEKDVTTENLNSK